MNDNEYYFDWEISDWNNDCNKISPEYQKDENTWYILIFFKMLILINNML